MPRAYLALGGNLGPVEQTFRDAIDRLDRTPGRLDQTPDRLDQSPGISVLRVSSAVRTRAVGDNAGPDFLNAAAEIETSLSPDELLDRLQSVERLSGRVRGERWDARTLDLDLILYGEEVIETPNLVVPHPACWYRRFVLDPLSEIAPGAWHPIKNVTVRELRQRLCSRPFRLHLAGGDEGNRAELIRQLADQFPDVEVSHWQTGTRVSDAEPTIVAWLGATERHGTDAGLQSLPLVSRLDVSMAENAGTFLRDVLYSALGN